MIIGNTVGSNMPHAVMKTGDTMRGNIDMDNHKLTGLPKPESETDAVPKGYMEEYTKNYIEQSILGGAW